ncbi:Uncharacterised protein [uncultured archaeon]|nr:Uncharacterised protein [uncultured archaeon]
MDSKVILQVIDEVNCRFLGLPPEIRRKLYLKYKVFNPANRYIPAYRLQRWDGCWHYFAMNGATFINILEPILEDVINEGYEIEIDDLRNYNRSFDFSPIDNNFLSNYQWTDGPIQGQPIILRPHQTESINAFLKNLQGIQSIPTSGGKTLIIAALSKIIEKYGRSVIIVPSKDLIAQTEKYYHYLNLDVGVYFGDRKDFFKKHTICTWQSLSQLAKEPIDAGMGELVTFQRFSQGIVATIVDECQNLRGTVLKDLMTKQFAKVPIRWAVTGTVPREPHEIINLTISIGNVVHQIATNELQEKGILSNCDVKILQLIDNRVFSSYATEYSYLVSDPVRLKYIASLIRETSKKGNILVLVGRKKTGKDLEKLIPDSVFLSGENDTQERRKEYNEVAESYHKVIIATEQIAGTGIDMPRLNHLFLIEPGKSFIRTIQSVGRVLRTASDKNYAVIWDICSTCKYSKRHLTQRKKYYKEQKFPFTLDKVAY